MHQKMLCDLMPDFNKIGTELEVFLAHYFCDKYSKISDLENFKKFQLQYKTVYQLGKESDVCYYGLYLNLSSDELLHHFDQV